MQTETYRVSKGSLIGDAVVVGPRLVVDHFDVQGSSKKGWKKTEVIFNVPHR